MRNNATGGLQAFSRLSAVVASSRKIGQQCARCCLQRQDKSGSSNRKAEDQAQDLVRSLQIASLLGTLRSAVDKIDEQLAATMVCKRQIAQNCLNIVLSRAAAQAAPLTMTALPYQIILRSQACKTEATLGLVDPKNTPGKMSHCTCLLCCISESMFHATTWQKVQRFPHVLAGTDAGKQGDGFEGD